MSVHDFHLKGRWNGGLNGDGHIDVGNLASDISVPESMKGPGKGTNPEELLLGAAGTCYLITLAAILQRRNLTITSLELASEGYVNAEGGLKFTKIVHRPKVTLAAGADEAAMTTAREATARAEKACLISNAIRGNVEVLVEPSITTG